jgi:hypothetical protein
MGCAFRNSSVLKVASGLTQVNDAIVGQVTQVQEHFCDDAVFNMYVNASFGHFDILST